MHGVWSRARVIEITDVKEDQAIQFLVEENLAARIADMKVKQHKDEAEKAGKYKDVKQIIEEAKQITKEAKQVVEQLTGGRIILL